MINEFINLCCKSQDDLLFLLPKELKKKYKKVKSTRDYIYAKGNIPVLLVAHLDTVHKSLPKTIWIDTTGDMIKSDEGIGGDDRCGVFSIMYILKNIDKKFLPYVLFTTDEEIGGLGAATFCKNNKKLPVNCMIEIDRRGSNDVVRYDDGNDTLIDIFTKDLGFKEDFGSYTDICTLAEEYGISGVNLSSGYYRAHTTEEYVVFSEMIATAVRVITFLKNPKYYQNKHVYEEVVYTPKTYSTWNWNKWSRDRNNTGYIQCACCEQIHPEEDCVFLEDFGGYVCEDCFSYYQDEYVKCPDCEEYTYKGDGYCWNCGAPLQENNEEEEINIFNYQDKERGNANA